MELNSLIETAYQTFKERTPGARVVLLHPRSRYRSMLVAQLLTDPDTTVFYYAMGPDDVNVRSFLSGITHDLANQHPTFGRFLNQIHFETQNDMEALIDAGLCMADFGISMPASGSEHLLSHFWESRLLYEERPALLHGAKVGVGTSLIARYWEQVRGMSLGEAAGRLGASSLPDREQEIANIRAGWPFAVDQVLGEQKVFLDMDEAGYRALCDKVLRHWDDIQAIAAEVPAPDTVIDTLRRVCGRTTVAELGLAPRDLDDALAYAHYLRSRVPMLRLRRMLQIN